MPNMVFLTEDATSSFKPRRLKFKMAEIKIYILVISSKCTNVYHKIFYYSVPHWGKCKVRPGSDADLFMR